MEAHRRLCIFTLGLLAACGGGTGTAGPPDDTIVTPIASVQGAGNVSPLADQTVTIDGIVSGDFQSGDGNDGDDLGGFFMMSAAADGDRRTSDGVFVFDGGNPETDVGVGDVVRVAGRVQEHFGETQIVARSVSIIGEGSPRPADIALPAAGVTLNADDEPVADLEAYEGMLVRLRQVLTITELRNLERFGALTLSSGGRLEQFTNQRAPDAEGYAAHRLRNAARSLELDDGRRDIDVRPIRYLDAGTPPDVAIRTGDTVSGLTGVLRYSRGSGAKGDETWRLMPVETPVFVASNPRPGAPELGGALRIASFNVLNYFSTVDDGNDDCGPAGSDNCRGADSAMERQRQLAKIVTALALIDADVVGLVELENNASQSLEDIVIALNGRVGAGTFAFVDTGTIGDDVIKSGFIFKPSTVSTSGPFAVLDASVDARFNDDRNRPALAQTFTRAANGASLTVCVNHLKSKGSDCAADGDPNTGDGQGNCNLTRTSAATALADWLGTDPTGSGDRDVLIIGDLNAYLEEDPVTALEAAGYVNLVRDSAGGTPYSFVFDGQAGALDHALASPTLAAQVVGAMEWHINADEARARDYNLEHARDPGTFEPMTPYRASDHDPVIVGIDLN